MIIVSRMALIVADVIVLGVTWAATRETYRSQDLLRRFGRTTTLSSVLYTNGAAFDFRPSRVSNIIVDFWMRPLGQARSTLCKYSGRAYSGVCASNRKLEHT